MDLSGINLPADSGMIIIQGKTVRKILDYERSQCVPKDSTATSWANQDTEERFGLECIERFCAGKLDGFIEFMQSRTNEMSKYRLENLIRDMRQNMTVGNSTDASLQKRIEFGIRILCDPQKNLPIIERWKAQYMSPIRPLPTPLSQTLDLLLLSYIQEFIPNATPDLLFNKIQKDFGMSSGQASRTRLLFA